MFLNVIALTAHCHVSVLRCPPGWGPLITCVLWRGCHRQDVFQTGCYNKAPLRVSYLDQQGLGVVLKATDPGVVCSVFDPRQGGLPGGHARAQEHGADGMVCM